MATRAVEALRRNPQVVSVEPDRKVTLSDQSLPTGVDRIDADRNGLAKIDGTDERVDVDVAVLDTGVDYGYPDLNVWRVADCTGETTNDGTRIEWDRDVHGTHVAGTIGALDNEIGVVGVAPGARIWSVRVLDSSGSGYDSWIICGLDLVAKYATDQGDGAGTVDVANLSLGGRGRDSDCATDRDRFHRAFCRTVAAGVTVVVAAGNAGIDAKYETPAAYDEVITVSAQADSDGNPGGNDPRTLDGRDDTFAQFSNYGADVDIAAPGFDIRSTWPTYFRNSSGYQRLSGTSMVSPHVAGAAVLYLAANAGASPKAVKAALQKIREPYAMPNDPDWFNEGIVNVADGGSSDPNPDPEPDPEADTEAPTIAIMSPQGGDRVRNRSLITMQASDADSGVAKVVVRYCAGDSCQFEEGQRIRADGTEPCW
jgi:subtilisin family serine protease